MTPDDLRDARGVLGRMYGLDGPLTMREMGSLLKLRGDNPGASIRDYERGKTAITGPLELVIEALLDGWRPAHLADLMEHDWGWITDAA